MTPERFRLLLEAYGAELERWPEAERPAARALASESIAVSEEMVDAASLDALLDTYQIAPPTALLIQQVSASMPARLPKRTAWRPWTWPWTGLAGIGLAGSFVGVLAVGVALKAVAPRAEVEWIERSTAFSEPSPDWSNE